MAENKENGKNKNKKWNGGGGAGPVYFLGMIGALVFYIQESEGFWRFLLAILKALVWPAFVVYDLLKFLT